jgi:hypothetical protein
MITFAMTLRHLRRRTFLTPLRFHQLSAIASDYIAISQPLHYAGFH